MVGTQERVERALAQLRASEDAEARAAAFAGVPLEDHLEAGGPAARAAIAEALSPRMDGPAVLASAFAGLANPHSRALAALLAEMAQAAPDMFTSTLTGCLYAREADVQRTGLHALCEVPEDLARPILAQFPAELALPECADAYREVNTAFELRRTFRNSDIAYYPLRCLGLGGMGAVWLARDLRRGRLAALKFLKAFPDGRFDPDLLARFEREARVPLHLDHPNLLKVVDHGEGPGLHWIDVDFIRGETLQQRLEREGPRPWREAARLASQVAAALDHLHAKRIVHRDVKPANLFLSGERTVLGDFGLVHIADTDLQAAVPGYEATQAHLILGSIGYMSPEQATSGPVDGRSDLFSLGAVMYRSLTGELPYGATSFRDYLRALSGVAPPPPLPSGVPRSLAMLVEQLLQRAPEDRPPNAAAVISALAALDRAVDADADTSILDARTVAPAVSPDADTSAFVAPKPSLMDQLIHEASAPPPRLEDVLAASPEPPPLPEPPPPPPPQPPPPALALGAPSSTAAEFAANFKRVRTSPDPVTPEGRQAAARGLRPPAEERGWCPTCRVETDSRVEGCLTCRGLETPWAPTLLRWGLVALGAYCLAPLVLDRVPAAPRLAALAGSRPLTAAIGAGALWIATGLGRLRNWAYVAGTALTALTGTLAAGAAYALGRAAPSPAHVHHLARLAGVETGGRGADFALRILHERWLHPLAVTAVAMLCWTAMLLARDCRHHYRRHWTPAAQACAAGALALVLVPLAWIGHARW